MLNPKQASTIYGVTKCPVFRPPNPLAFNINYHTAIHILRNYVQYTRSLYLTTIFIHDVLVIICEHF